MSKFNQFVSNQRWLLKTFACMLFGLLLLTRVGYSQTQTINAKPIVLQGSIQIQPANPIPGDQTGKIQPGTPVKLMVTVENQGQQTSPVGQLYIRYAFAPPLENEARSNIFETEKKSLPSIEPGKKIDIAFDNPHLIPSLLDFVRYDWPIREYQAIAIIDHKDYMIGSLAMTFSAYYYPGIKKEFPTPISQ